MNPHASPMRTAIAGIFALGLGTSGAMAAAAPCSPCSPRSRRNPCAAQTKNPCAAKGNPCVARNPSAAMNPCAAGTKVDAKLVTRPKGTKLATGNRAEMIKLGEALFKDTKLSTNNMSCNTCHQGGASFQASFAKPYPHYVAMAKEQGGFKRINLDEMIQFCLLVPMAGKPLAWDSKELSALTAYTAQVQKSFKPAGAGKANPCAAKDPRSARNPCAAKNPCAPAANPCAAKTK